MQNKNGSKRGWLVASYGLIRKKWLNLASPLQDFDSKDKKYDNICRFD
jgi:hypothetical protein